MKLFITTLLLFSFSGCTTQKNVGNKTPQTLQEALTSSYRSTQNMFRDNYRHPHETLEFFGLKPEMSVIELTPSRGWYTEILAPYLNEKGEYIIAEPAEDPRGYTIPRKEWFNKHPEIKSKTVVFTPGGKIALGPDNSVDLVLTFRNIHNWLPQKNIEEAFKQIFKVLKPGGVLGVVEHRANPKIKFDPKSGYMLEKDVIKMIEKAGFRLQGKNEVNANPKDKANHPHGVWSLPPSLKGGETDKEKYMAIGESDRMTLKFVKPATK